jgi:hypothetical protein
MPIGLAVTKLCDGSIIYDYGGSKLSPTYRPLMDLACVIAEDAGEQYDGERHRYSSMFVSKVFVRLMKHTFDIDLPERWK